MTLWAEQTKQRKRISLGTREARPVALVVGTTAAAVRGSELAPPCRRQLARALAQRRGSQRGLPYGGGGCGGGHRGGRGKREGSRRPQVVASQNSGGCRGLDTLSFAASGGVAPVGMDAADITNGFAAPMPTLERESTPRAFHQPLTQGAPQSLAPAPSAWPRPREAAHRPRFQTCRRF